MGYDNTIRGIKLLQEYLERDKSYSLGFMSHDESWVYVLACERILYEYGRDPYTSNSSKERLAVVIDKHLCKLMKGESTDE